MTTAPGPASCHSFRCFLCLKTFESALKLGDYPFVDDESVVKRQREFIYLFNKLLEVPSDPCVDYLEKFAYSTEWISTCSDCTLFVDEGRKIYEEMVELEWRHRKIGEQLKRKLMWGRDVDGDEGQVVFGQLTQEMRQYLKTLYHGPDLQVRRDANIERSGVHESGGNVQGARDENKKEDEEVCDKDENFGDYEDCGEDEEVCDKDENFGDYKDCDKDEEDCDKDENFGEYKDCGKDEEDCDKDENFGDYKDCGENIENKEESSSSNEDSEENEIIPEKIADVEAPLEQNENSDPLGDCIKSNKKEKQEIQTGPRRSSRKPKKSAKLQALENDEFPEFPEPTVKRHYRKRRMTKEISADSVLEKYQGLSEISSDSIPENEASVSNGTSMRVKKKREDSGSDSDSNVKKIRKLDSAVTSNEVPLFTPVAPSVFEEKSPDCQLSPPTRLNESIDEIEVSDIWFQIPRRRRIARKAREMVKVSQKFKELYRAVHKNENDISDNQSEPGINFGYDLQSASD